MRLLVATLLLVFLADAAQAQRRFAEQGDLALVIGVNGLENLVLRPYEGGLGLRYRASDQTVVGAAVGLGFSSRDFTGENETPQGGEMREASSDGQRVSLALWTEQHIGRRRRTVSPFVGAGLQVSAWQNESEQVVGFACPEITDCPPVQRVEGEGEALSIGGGLIVGAEVRLARGVTLGGAYTLGAEYRRSESEFVRDSPDGPFVSRDEADGWEVGVGTTQVGLSIYF